MTALDVYLHRDRVGRLERLPQAKLEFGYESGWLEAGGAPVSLSLPLRAEPFPDESCRPFFSGLLPEGGFLKAVAKALHVSAENPFSVLEEIGGECAGAVSLMPVGTMPPFERSSPPRWLDDEGLARVLAEMPMRPLLVGFEGEDEVLRLSLAGAQNKVGLLSEDGRLAITRGDPPSSHILKKPDLDLPELVANEAYCLNLAREAGLAAIEAEPVSAGDQEGLLVRRYDRVEGGGDGTIRRLHQEDFCQALGFLPEEKYEADGGPGVGACADLLRAHASAPGPELLAFLDALLFNLLIHNADAHSKNYSLLIGEDGSRRLAPLYDLLAVSVYGGRYGRKLAMKYGGEYRPRYVRGRHLDALADDLGVARRTVRRRAGDMTERVVNARVPARAALPERWQQAEVVDRIDGLIDDSTERLRAVAAERD